MNQESYEKTMKLLERYKLPFADSKLVSSVPHALNFAKKVGFPVVLKAIAPQIVHKTDMGAIKIGIANEKQLEEEFNDLVKKAKQKRIRLEGVLVQKQVAGKEIIIGLKSDPSFGRAIMFGIGGIFVEILEDVSFRIPPLDEKEALEMIKEVKGYKILEGARGEKRVNIEDIANLIVKISKIADDDKIYELEFNPVIVDEHKATIADIRLIKNK